MPKCRVTLEVESFVVTRLLETASTYGVISVIKVEYLPSETNAPISPKPVTQKPGFTRRPKGLNGIFGRDLVLELLKQGPKFAWEMETQFVDQKFKRKGLQPLLYKMSMDSEIKRTEDGRWQLFNDNNP